MLSEERLVKTTGLSQTELLHLVDAGKIEFRVIEKIAKEIKVPVYGLMQLDSVEWLLSDPDEISKRKNENQLLHQRVSKLEQILIEEGIWCRPK